MRLIKITSEKLVRIRKQKIVYVCDFCGKGEMHQTNWTRIKGGEEEYKHECTVCKAEVFLKQKYPQYETKVENIRSD